MTRRLLAFLCITSLVGFVTVFAAEPKPLYVKKSTRADTIQATLKASGYPDFSGKWHWTGPFDNTGLKGFQAELPGKVEWKDHATGHPRGIVDLYVALGKKKGVDPATKKKDAVYALARVEVESPDDREVEIRAATQNAIRMYVNGEHVFSREEYHHGDTLDQHVGRAKLKKGSNEILVKVCQDDATMMWTLVWQFQLRVCDYLGTPAPIKILSALNAVPVKPEPEKKEPSK